MTVESSQYKLIYNTTGSETVFNFNFKVTDATWIECYLAESPTEPPVQVTDFTVTLNPDQETAAGGTVTFDAPVPAGNLAIIRQTPLTQQLDYTAYGAFPAESHEEGMDKLTYSQQWTLGEISRSVRYGYVTDFELPEWVTLEKFVEEGYLLYWKDENTLSSAERDGIELGLATIEYVDAADAVLQGQITANASTIGSNTSRITANEGNIAANAGNISTNTSDISTNEGNIATNTSNIATNTSNIATNAGDIATNAGNIATNEANIAANTAAIAENTLGVGALEPAVEANAGDIATNTGNIATNTGNILTKADKSVQVISNSLDMMYISNPTLDSDVNIGLNANVALGTVQLDEFGFVPEGHLPPNGGLRLFGIWDATGGDNPTDTRPDLVPYKSGDTYVIGVDGGTIDLLDPVTGLYVPTSVIEGDLIIFVINYDETIQGWAKGANVDTGSVTAALVSFEPAGDITSLNVQAGMEELDTKKLAKTGGDMSGSVTFTNGNGIQGTRADSMPVSTFYLDIADQLVIGSPSISLLYNYLGADGASWHNASSVAVMTLNQVGSLSITGDLRMPNSRSLYSGNAAGDANISIASISSADQIMFGESTGPLVAHRSADRHLLQIGTSTKLQVDANGIQVTGDVTLKNNNSIISRNAADNGDIPLLYGSPNNEVVLGYTNATTVVRASSTIELNLGTQTVLEVNVNGVDVTGNATSSLAPTAADHLTRKDYVDNVLADRLFPVGTVILRANDVDPNSTMAGTWVNKGVSHSLHAVSPDGSQGVVGAVGGDNAVAVPLLSHSHTATFAGAALPAHGHPFATCNGGVDGTYGTLEYSNSTTQLPPNVNQVHAASAGTPTGTVTVTAAGEAAPVMNVIGATYNVVAWERTA